MGNKRGQSRADIILQEANQRVIDAREIVRASQENLVLAEMRLATHEEVYAALEKALVRTPRKASAPKPAPSAIKKSKQRSEPAGSTQNSQEETASATPASNGSGLCATCGNVETFEDHDPKSEVYHIFRTTLKKRGKPEPTILPDDPETFVHEATA